jgi:deoxyribose-phosphate aldolase
MIPDHTSAMIPVALSVHDVSYEQLAGTIDLSLVRPQLTLTEVTEGCALAAEYEVVSVCVRPSDVALAAKELAGTTVAVTTVVSFPHGDSTTDTKVHEASRAMEDGAVELDMVMNIGLMLSGEHQAVQDDIAAVVGAAAGNAMVKVILENAYLTDAEKVRGSRLTEAAGADFVKTSTGKASSGATPGAVLVMLEAIRDYAERSGRAVGMKAAGGVSTSKAALHRLVLVKETLGDDWLTPDRFRIGASSLLNDLLMQYQKTQTGRYSRPEDFSKE